MDSKHTTEPVAWRITTVGGRTFFEDKPPESVYSQEWLARCQSVMPLYAAPTAPSDDVRDALEFYADPTRYMGPNQPLDAPDKWSEQAGLRAYRLDVTRDGGVIARLALAAMLSTPKD